MSSRFFGMCNISFCFLPTLTNPSNFVDKNNVSVQGHFGAVLPSTGPSVEASGIVLPSRSSFVRARVGGRGRQDSLSSLERFPTCTDFTGNLLGPCQSRTPKDCSSGTSSLFQFPEVCGSWGGSRVSCLSVPHHTCPRPETDRPHVYGPVLGRHSLRRSPLRLSRRCPGTEPWCAGGVHSPRVRPVITEILFSPLPRGRIPSDWHLLCCRVVGRVYVLPSGSSI